MKTGGSYTRHGNSGDLVWKKPSVNRFIKYMNGWKIGVSAQNGLTFFNGE